jgi:hypothetical protein
MKGFWVMAVVTTAGALGAMARPAAQVPPGSALPQGQPAPQPGRLGSVPVPGFDVRALPEEQFQRLHAAVAPRGDGERWMEIPWETDLAAARERAAREKKPLLMWIMDGHPLGCT